YSRIRKRANSNLPPTRIRVLRVGGMGGLARARSDVRKASEPSEPDMTEPHRVDRAFTAAARAVDERLVEARRLISAAALSCLKNGPTAAAQVSAALHEVDQARCALAKLQELPR